MNKRILTVLLLGVLSSGCSIMAPKYTTNYAAVATLKSAELGTTKVGEITKDTSKQRNVNALTIRGSSYNSPYGSFTKYFEEALKDELDHADLLGANASTEISGALIRNILDGSGISVGFAEIEAKVMIRNNGSIVYESTKSVRHEWPSSFVGGVAIPRAAQNYPLAVRKLLNEFYSDPGFIAALKPRQ